MTAILRWLGDGWAIWAGHYEPAFMAAALAALTASNLTRYQYHDLTSLTALATAAWIAAMIADMSRHQPGLCERCAADVPLDPQVAVTRRTPALRLYHSRWFRAAIAIIAWELADAGAIAVSVNSTRILGTPGGPWYYAAVLLGIPAFILAAAFVLTRRTHRKLRPWRPYCSWGSGGDEEAAPEPDPQDDGIPSPAA